MASVRLSAAQEFLLRRFIFPSTIEHVIEANPNWGYSLGEEPRVVIDRFISERLLKVASLEEKLIVLSIDELQKAMKDTGETIEEMERDKIVQTLLSSSGELTAKLEAIEMYTCTEKGRQVITGQTIRLETSVVRGARKAYRWLDRKGVTGNMIYDALKKIIPFLGGAITMSLRNWLQKALENMRLRYKEWHDSLKK